MLRFAVAAAAVATVVLAATPRGAESCQGQACLQDEEGALLQVHRAGGARGVADAGARRAEQNTAHQGIPHTELGCFPRAPGDDANSTHEFMDDTCIDAGNFSAQAPCRSGMPFYRLLLAKEQGRLDCFTFCLSKGLDLFGLIGPECRCGATPENRAAWLMRTPPPSLLLPLDSRLPYSDPGCEMMVWKYAGQLEDFAVPLQFLKLSASDTQYMDEIASSGLVNGEGGEDDDDDDAAAGTAAQIETMSNGTRAGAPGEALLGSSGVCEDAKSSGLMGKRGEMSCAEAAKWCNRPGYKAYLGGLCPLSCGICKPWGNFLRCYPNQCASGAPWPKENGMVNIRYWFATGLDHTRRHAFRAATKWWEDATCVKFREAYQSPRLHVTVTKETSCTAQTGYLKNGKANNIVNLGSCNSMKEVGMIAHELGHVLGMGHEQQRPDGNQRFRTSDGWKGPYLQVNWGVVGVWKSQYVAKKEWYIGSQNVGYVPYNYDSILHYNNHYHHFSTINKLFNSDVGQRDHLSKGDILQFEDMYQCRSRGLAPRPTPRPTPMPTPRPTPMPTRRRRSRQFRPTSSGRRRTTSTHPGQCRNNPNFIGPWEDTCESWRGWVEKGEYKCQDYTMWKGKPTHLLESCPLACRTCSARPPSCADDPDFVGQFDDTCAKWAGWMRSGKYKCKEWLVYEGKETGISKHCPVACEACGQPCADDASYVGQFNEKCSKWIEWRKNGYTCKKYEKDEPRLLKSCPYSCGICSGSTGDVPPTITTTTTIAPCEDDPTYVGPYKDTCKKWSRWMRTKTYDCRAYDEAGQTPGVMKRCPVACGTCGSTGKQQQKQQTKWTKR